MTAIAQQPVSVAIEADQKDFQLYQSGVLTSECGTTLDHGVLAIGYGTENGEDYYLVKNSWGTSWGDEGYIKLGRGPSYNDGQGQCGILLQASYPVL
jgi:C1A family cysteine protease